jgi:hypothetical protein
MIKNVKEKVGGSTKELQYAIYANTKELHDIWWAKFENINPKVFFY